jgi:hypothetical protein
MPSHPLSGHTWAVYSVAAPSIKEPKSWTITGNDMGLSASDLPGEGIVRGGDGYDVQLTSTGIQWGSDGHIR